MRLLEKHPENTWVLLILFSLIFQVGAHGDPSAFIQNHAKIRTLEVGTGKVPVVLLHGYGSSPQEWLPFTKTIHLPNGSFFIFPEGPGRTVPPDGPLGGRAWWRLDLASYIKPGGSIPDLSDARPEGLKESASDVRDLIHE